MATTETLLYAAVELDDTERKEGRLLSIGDVEYALSDTQGNLEAGTVEISLSDIAGRPIGQKIDSLASRNFQRDEIAIFARSDKGRTTNATPKRIGRALVQDAQYGTPVVAKFSGTDPFFCDGGAFNTDKNIPTWTIPPDYYYLAPTDVYSKALAIIIGEVSDEGATDPATGLPASRGLCPLTFVGIDTLGTGANGAIEPWGRFNVSLFACYKILGVYGSDFGGGIYGRSLFSGATSDGAEPQSTITLAGNPDLSNVSANGDVAITLYTPTQGKQERQIIAKTANTVTINNSIAVEDCTDVDWYITSDLPQRQKIDLNRRNGPHGDCMVFGWPQYIKPTTYEDILSGGESYRIQDVWIRGPLLDAHMAGEITLTANVIGIEDAGDATGKPITDFFTAYQWALENLVIVNSKQPRNEQGTGHWPFLSDLITYADGTYLIKGSSFVEAQAQSALVFGGRGFQVSAYFGDTQFSIRDFIALWNDNGNCRLGINEHGQIFCYRFNALDDPSTWPVIDHVSRIFGDVIRTNPQAETENVVQGQCDYDPDGQRYRNQLVQIVSPAGLAHNKNIRKYSKVIDGRLTRDPKQFDFVLKERLAALHDGPVYVEVTGDIGLLDYPIGSGIRLTSIMGPGALGYVERPLIILKKKFQVDSHLVTLTCLDPTGDISDGVSNGLGGGAFIPSPLEFIFEGSDDPISLGDEALGSARVLTFRAPGTIPLPPPPAPPPPTTTPPATPPSTPPPAPPPPGPAPTGSVQITGGADIMGVVSLYPAGTTFFLQSGSYTEQTIHPRNYDIFIGDTSAILNGGHLLTSPSGSGPWAYTGQSAEGPYDTVGGAAYKADRQASGHPEDVFIDSVVQWHVNSLAEVTVGTWYFDYGASTIYIGTDPSGHIVSTSTTAKAIDAAGVIGAHFSHLIIEQYATPTQTACVSLGSGCVMQYCEVRTSHYAGIENGPGSQSLSNIVHHNGVFGFIGSGDPIIDGNVVYNNNTVGGDEFWGAGGSKWVFAEGLIVRNNHSYDNIGPGFWCDINNNNVLYEQNIFENNTRAGIFHEISYAAIIRYNTCTNNGNNLFGSYPTEAQISICDSPNVEVYGNVLSGGYWGLGVLQDDRGAVSADQNHGVWQVSNFSAHNNTIAITVGVAAGMYAPDASYFSTRNNTFYNNTYTLNGVSTAFQWGSGLTQSGWNAAGQS